MLWSFLLILSLMSSQICRIYGYLEDRENGILRHGKKNIIYFALKFEVDSCTLRADLKLWW